MEELAAAVEACRRCGLCEARHHPAVGEGNPHADIMFIGEGPGHEEDMQGRPFVGPAGQLLDKMMASIGLARNDVYIANIVKCRPPGNRNPSPQEATACMPYLRRQYLEIQPKILVLLGAVASRQLIDPGFSITKEHGNWFRLGNTLVLPTFHPAALLRDPSKKADSWEDLKKLQAKYQSMKEQI